MKRISCFILIVLSILTACSSSPAGQGQPATATQEPTYTFTPTQTLEPSPTPDTRFSELMPATLEECMEENVIRWGHLKEDLPLLIEKEKMVSIDASKIQPIRNGAPNTDIQQFEMPSFISLTFETQAKNNVVSCSYLEAPQKEGILIYGIAVKRPGSEIVGIVHFAYSLRAKNTFNSQINYTPEFSETEQYQRFKNGEYNEIGIHLILWRAFAKYEGVWDNLLRLTPNQNPANPSSDYYLMHGKLWHSTHSTDQEAEEVFKYWEKKILPAITLGIAN